ncbi:MAG TPA: glycosyltransferase [Planctomycetota bacterium]|nr:glycosyltransferase [Planctomycetota bacterium]
MKTLYFDAGLHADLVGGGGLALYNLSVALQEKYDVWLRRPWDEGMMRYEFLRPPKRPFKIGEPHHADVFVASSYNSYLPPKGDVNVWYCLYPKFRWDMTAYQKILTLSKYSQGAIKDLWERDSEILIGGAFAPDWRSGEKENIFLTNARFFMEGDPDRLVGHSKGHHLIVQAFRELPGDLPWKLIVTGSVILESDGRYLEACRRLAGDDPRIHFIDMASRETLQDLYARSRVFVHAMGYGRTDPAETEHYGISVEKGLLSGCFTIVHASGGAPEMAHVKWETPADLRNLMVGATYAKCHQEIAQAYETRTWEAFVEQTLKVFDF